MSVTSSGSKPGVSTNFTRGAFRDPGENRTHYVRFAGGFLAIRILGLLQALSPGVEPGFLG